jgi:DNA sulfur modification protein DndC
MARRAGLYGALEDALHRGFYTDVDDATAFARRKRDALDAAQRADLDQLDLFSEPNMAKADAGAGA